MKRLLSILAAIALLCPGAQAAEYVTMLLTTTNQTWCLTNTYTVNGSTRAGTNTADATHFATNGLATVSASNIFSQAASWPFPGVLLSWVSPTSMTFRGVSLTAGSSSNWCWVTLTTNSTTNASVMLYPFAPLPLIVQTNQITEIVNALGKASNAIAEGNPTLSNFVQRGASQTMGNKLVTNSIWNGVATGSSITNARMTNITISGLNSFGSLALNAGLEFLEGGTNRIVQDVGLPIDIPAGLNLGPLIATNPVIFGSNLTLGVYSSLKTASGILTLGSGDGNAVSVPLDLWVNGLYATNFHGIAGSMTMQSLEVGFGTLTNSTGTFSNGVLKECWSTNLVATNSTLAGSNTIPGSIFFPSVTVAGLVVGNNEPMLGTNTYQRLTGSAGTDTVTSFKWLGGTAQPPDGAFYLLQFSGQTTLTLANNSGSATAVSMRINTGTGADVSITNNPAMITVVYDSAAQRWQILSLSR